MSFLRFLFRRHPFVSAAFALALGLLVVFSVGFVREALYFSDPAHRNQTLEGWMTPGYVGHSWDLPPEYVRDSLGLTEAMKRDGQPMTLTEIAQIQGVSIADLQSRVEAARAELDLRRREGRGHDPRPDAGGPDQMGPDQ